MQRIDNIVVKKVNKLVKDGDTSVAEMEMHLGFYIKKELYDSFASARSWEPPIFPKSIMT